MKFQTRPRARAQAGYSALLITLFIVGASVLILGATLTRSVSNVRLNDRNALYISANGAAEAAVEKVIAHMMVDFSIGQESYVLSNLTTYQTMLPSTNENPYWANFVWSDAQGHDNRIYVARRTNGISSNSYVQLERQYTNLSGFSSMYRILANVSMKNTTYNYRFTNAVQQDVQLATIPVFQFAIFYNGLLEFSDCAPLVVNNGPVHCNSNIYVGTISGSSLTFNSIVSATGVITNPANCGYSQSQWKGPIKYNGSPKPGYLTGAPSLMLPIGTNSLNGDNVRQILYPPSDSSEGVYSPMGLQRYYNKANMILWISNNNTFSVTLKLPFNDPSPYVSNNIPLNVLTNNISSNYYYFLTVTNKMYDTREDKTMLLTQIDVGKLYTWMLTNIYCYDTLNRSNVEKFSGGNPLNIVYVADWRNTNGATNVAIRLIDGGTIPPWGLTVATPNPLYIQDLFNCPSSSYEGKTNVSGLPAASVACDALTILSPNWSDSASWNNKGNGQHIPTADDDTVNAAVITGNVPSTGPGTYQNSGGVHNLPRLLESWGSAELTLNTSLICLFSSSSATGLFIPPGVSTSYYTAPNRNFNFNVNYTSSSGLPPGTPAICALIRSSWCNPQPNNTNYDFVALDFVPH